MALVRISRELLHEVCNGINNFSSKVYNNTVKPLYPQQAVGEFKGGEIYEFCLRKAWGEHYDLFDMLKGTKFVRETDRFDLRVTDPTTNDTFEVKVFPDQGKIAVPNWMGAYGYADVKAPASELHMLTWAPKFFADRASFSQAKADHDLKFSTIWDQVRGFLSSSKSLNDAIKKYPDIKLWIPQHYLDKVEEKVERAPRAVREQQEAEAAVATIDHTLLASMGVLKSIQAA